MLLLFCSLALFSCTNESKPAESKTDSTATAAKETLSYPYSAKYTLNWQPGDEKNAVIVLNCLKKYCDGDVKGSMAYMADTAEFIADRIHLKLTRDSLGAVFTKMRATFGSITAEPDTWITTYYPEKKDTWVTVWYTQKWTDLKGKADSAYYTDDVLVKEGKILQIDEKQRFFPEAKK